MTLNFSESGSIRALGNQVACGVMFAFALSVTLLPAVLALLPFSTNNSTKDNKQNSRFSGITDVIFKYRTTLFPLSILVSVALGYCLTLNEFNDNISTYFAKSLP